MPVIQVEGDANDGGGIVTDTFQTKVYVGNKLVALQDSIGTEHPPAPLDPKHNQGVWKTKATHSNAHFLNRLVVVKNDPDTCLHKRIGQSNKFYFFGS